MQYTPDEVRYSKYNQIQVFNDPQPMLMKGQVHISIVRIFWKSSRSEDWQWRKHFATISIDGRSRKSLDHTLASEWNEKVTLHISGPGTLNIGIYAKHAILQNMKIGSFEEDLETLVSQSLNKKVLSRPLRGCSGSESGLVINFNVECEIGQDCTALSALVQRAKIQASRLSQLQMVSNRMDVIACTNGNIDDMGSLKSTWGPLLEKLQIFKNLAGTIAKVHPYAQVAYDVIFVASEIVLKQMERDNNIISLAEAMDDAWAFVKEAEPLSQMNSRTNIINHLAQQTTDCGYFISAYCGNKSWVRRALKHCYIPTDQAIVQYGQKFIELKAALLGHSAISTEMMVSRILRNMVQLKERMVLENFPYAAGACFQTEKCCHFSTRQEIMSKIIGWIDNPESNPGNIFLLTGAAGTEKSGVAHAISKHYHRLDHLGSSIFTCVSDETVVKTTIPFHLIFPTIARDIADLDPKFRHALYAAASSMAVRTSRSPMDQFTNFILTPSQYLAILGPIVVVLDGIDQMPESSTRGNFLSVLTQRAQDLPSNFRILVTSRPDSPIMHHFSSVKALTVKIEDFDQQYTNYRLLQFARSQLHARGLNIKQEQQLHLRLVQKSQGSFQCMAKACSELCGMNVELDSQALSLHLPGREQHMPLVPPEDSLYQQEIDYLQRTGGKTITEGIDFLKGNLRNSSISMTLKEIIDFRKLANEQFQGNSHENTLGIINTLFLNPSDDYFERFLCDKARSGELDMTGSNYHVAFAKACLRLLKMGSKSYIMPPQLPSSIPPELCYASKFWLRHAIAGLPTKPKELDAVIIELLESCDISWVYILNTLQCTNIAVEGIKQLTSYYACASENIKDSFMDKLEHYKMRMNQFLTFFGDNAFQSSENIISTNFKSAPPTQWTCTTHYTYSNQILASYTEQNDCPYLISLPLEGSSKKHLQRLCIEVKCHDQGKRFTCM
ncbi:hypothetical protein C8R41DRAFT_958545 [Lentinula lateritia]|uniref:C2 domain-containing protein n=1 Tax=Lentinula lateritia TaxID=40482 RepID=A0ABQ8VDW4_9AGAR|nr:hypothetical protein C8R41DRAFT_958545 [Lentinula lateritia]